MRLSETIWMDEARVTLNQLNDNGIAVFVKKKRVVMVFANKLEAYFQADRNERAIIIDQVGVGYIRFETVDCKLRNTYEIAISAARKGYGPLLYELAMSLTNGGWLLSDRSSVSNKALNIWNHMQLRDDVRQIDVDKVCPQKNRRNDEALGYAYQLRNPIDYQPLHNSAMELVKQLEPSEINAEYILAQLFQDMDEWALDQVE